MTPDRAARDVYVFLMQGENCKAHAPDSYNCGICRNHIASALARAHAEGKAEGLEAAAQMAEEWCTVPECRCEPGRIRDRIRSLIPAAPLPRPLPAGEEGK